MDHGPGSTSPLPRLVPNLQLCLTCLYGPNDGTDHSLPSPSQTHEFLMQLQTRNVRRQLQSIHQQHRDSQNNNTATAANDTGETVHMGSSWLACLALLCRTDDPVTGPGRMTASTERLFCAQTLLHRCRSVKLVEAIDFEFEAYTDSDQKAHLLQIHQITSSMAPDTLARLVQSYTTLMDSLNPLVGQVLRDSFHYSPDEERTKAELTILTLATVAVQLAHRTETEPNDAHAPLLSTTVSALATTAFRLCYTQSVVGTNDDPSLVSLLRHVFGLVGTAIQRWDTAMTATTTLSVAFLSTVASVPDVVLGSPGGARGRLSADPRAIQAASRDLRSEQRGGAVLLHVLSEHSSANANGSLDVWVLQTCARWATFLPLSRPILQLVLPLLNRHLVSECEPHRTIAYSFLVAVYDGASWSVDQILSSSLGFLSEQSHPQQSKKKPTSRSKRRQKEKINSNTNDSSIPEAQAEQCLRGEIACQTTMYCWTVLNAAAQQALDAARTGQQVQGEGPIGCVAACANACLPHVVRNPSMPHGRELFRQISATVAHVCASPNVIVRALALEPLFTLHGVLLEVVQTTGPMADNDLVESVVHHFSHCLLNLSSVCPYPRGYFDHLLAESDQDLEIERNDIRDLLRTVSGSGEGGSTVDSGSDDSPLDVTVQILAFLVDSCRNAVVEARARSELCPEVAVHTFSSLAKPVNHLAKCFARNGGSEQVRQCLFTALQVLAEINRMIVEAFLQSIPESLILPLSRTVNIASASYAPFLAAMASLPETAEISEGLTRFLDVVIHASILSLERLPELPGPSILKHSIYDLRGTMRGPGGEDHVGCLTLMRCALENDLLSRMAVSCVPYIGRLCELHQGLKRIEIERGQHVFHGRGVTPQTRRILVGTLCRLEQASQGRLGASGMLTDILSSGISEIASFQVPLQEDELFRITETTLDLASFTPDIVASLFEPNDHELDKLACLDVLTSAFVLGWAGTACHEGLLQWNRYRAALFALVKKSATSDLSQRGAAIVVACVQCECESIQKLCGRGPTSTSTLYTDDIVSPESIPAGLFIRVIYETIRSQSGNSTTPPNCVQVLLAIKDAVLATIRLPCSEPHYGAFVDPRPTVTEAWLHVMIALTEKQPVEAFVEALVVETFATVVTLLFYPSIGKAESDRVNDIGMSFDGPHSLALTTFLGTFFRCGLISQASRLLVETFNVDRDSLRDFSDNQDFQGVVVIAASLFRACQGALPPWAIESIPDILSSLYEALGSNPDIFGRVIEASMALRLSKYDSHGFGGVAAGKLLSGIYFESMSSTAKSSFVQEAKQLAELGGASNWRRLKGLVKAVCGGKKKDTHFKQKPSAYRWEFDRV